MATEIERKFLVRRLPDLSSVPPQHMAQGYLRADANGSVRVRVSDGQAWLTVKGPTRGLSRAEFEYPIPVEDGQEMLTLCVGQPVEKTRYRLDHAGHVWELDVFSGSNQGLVLAEVELERADAPVTLPDWVGREVSDDARFYNSRLAFEPYSAWLDKPLID